MEFSVPMALVDFIPVICFHIATIFILRDLYNKMSKGAFSLLAAGMLDVFVAGSSKAIYKLLYAANICNFKALSNIFFPIQALGFTLAGVGIIAMLFFKQGQYKAYAIVPVFSLVYLLETTAPVDFSGTMIFVALMVIGLGLLDAGLSVISVKMKKPGLVAIFVVSFIFSLMMGYLSSKDFSQSYMNWVAEGVNCIGQASLMIGSILLHKNGMKDFVLITKAESK